MNVTTPVDLVIGVTGAVDIDALRAKMACLRGAELMRIVAALPGAEAATQGGEGIEFATYAASPGHDRPAALWADIAAAQRSILRLGAERQARACLVVHPDLTALEADTARRFTEPALSGGVELVMPVYPESKYGGLLNKSLLSPLSRALFGRRVQSPLPFDFCAGGGAIEKLVQNGVRRGQSDAQLLWPANTVAASGGRIEQATTAALHATPLDGMDLSAVLAEFAGALFEQAETFAAEWQRVRGSQAVPIHGDGVHEGESMEPIDAGPMVESFLIGLKNLEEVWRLVVPPATMLELKRIARMDAGQFRMPDALWARTVYDFSLAYRMRRLSRTHVLGALTPLYLGWVASYMQNVSGVTAQEADAQVEQLARVFEEQKPYFVSRWRWPERTS